MIFDPCLAMEKSNMNCGACVCDIDSMSIFRECHSNELIELLKSKKHAKIFLHMLKCLELRNHMLHNSLYESNSLIEKYKKRNRHLCNKLDRLERKHYSSDESKILSETCFKNQECLSHACHFVHTALKVFNSCLWYLDNGCSRHMTGDKSLFKSLKEMENKYVTFGNGSHSQV